MAHSLSSECSDRAVQLPFTVLIDRKHPLARVLCRGDILALTLLPDGRLCVGRRDGLQSEAVVERGTTVFPSLVILRLRTDDCIETLVLPTTATGAEAHRRLRVWLKWRASASV